MTQEAVIGCVFWIECFHIWETDDICGPLDLQSDQQRICGACGHVSVIQQGGLKKMKTRETSPMKPEDHTNQKPST